jgi:hypothetical protein
MLGTCAPVESADGREHAWDALLIATGGANPTRKLAEIAPVSPNGMLA